MSYTSGPDLPDDIQIYLAGGLARAVVLEEMNWLKAFRRGKSKEHRNPSF